MPNIKQMYEDNAHNKPAYPVVWLPVGTIYENRFDISDEIDKYFVGVWKRYGNGMVLVGVDENDATFNKSDLTVGEKTHTLTVEEMPSHTHTFTYPNSWRNGYTSGDNRWGFNADDATSQPQGINATGGSQAHNNIQPSRTVYRWVRIS